MTATDGGSPTAGGGTGGRPLGSAYVVHEVIGRGATGEVWKGTDRRTGAPVAVKILRPELTDDPRIVERFLRERAVLSELHAPNIVGLRDLVIEGDTVALVTDLVVGGDLRGRLREDGTLPPALAVDIVGQILDGLDVAHQRGVIHRDLKPENVLLDDGADGRPVVRITDFGIATLAFSTATVTTSIVGSPEYLAPEVIELGARTPAVDIYSAGIVLYELLAGRTPFAGGPPIAVVRRQVDDPPPRIPGVPVSLWSEVATLLAKDPAQRPGRARTAAKRLAELADELDGVPAIRPGAGEAGVVDLVAAEAADRRNGNRDGDRELLAAPENETTRVRGRHVVDEVVHRAPGTPVPERRRAWRRVAPLVAAGVVVVGIGGVYLARRGDAARETSVAYTAAPVIEDTGAVVTRTFALSGSKGDHLKVKLRVRNPTKKTIRKVQEPAIAGGESRALRQFDVDLQHGDETTVSYESFIAPGDVDLTRLEEIEQQLDGFPVVNRLALAQTEVDTIHIAPGQRAFLNVSGAANVESTSTTDVDNMLTALAWRSSDPRVAQIQNRGNSDWRPIVVAGHRGRAVLDAEVGTHALDVEVIVSGRPSDDVTTPCEPGVGDPPGLTGMHDGAVVQGRSTGEVFIIAGGARIHVRTSQEYTDARFTQKPEVVDDNVLDAIPFIPRDGTVLHDKAGGPTGRTWDVVDGHLVPVTAVDVAALHAPAPVEILGTGLYDIPKYDPGAIVPRDGTLVTDFARKSTLLWHEGGWKSTAAVCRPQDVPRLPPSAKLPSAA